MNLSVARLLRRCVAVLALVWAGTASLFAQDVGPATEDGTIDDAAIEKWHAFVRPDKAERHWQTLSWHPSLWDAVVAAHASKRPILLWAMNGHPLGCT